MPTANAAIVIYAPIVNSYARSGGKNAIGVKGLGREGVDSFMRNPNNAPSSSGLADKYISEKKVKRNEDLKN